MNSSDKSRSFFEAQNKIQSLPDAQRIVGDYLLNHTDELTNLSISAVSRKTNSSVATVTRFCQSLGFSGFQEFKYKFLNTYPSVVPKEQMICAGDNAATIIEKLTPLYTSIVQDVLSCIKAENIDRIAEMIFCSGRVMLVGQLVGGAVASLGAALYMQAGIIAQAYTDLSLASIAAANLKPGDVVIGISASGEAKTVVDALRIAKDYGATTAGITSNSSSHLAELSDILFCFHSVRENLFHAHLDRFGEIITLGLIQNRLLCMNTNEDWERTRDAFLSARYSAER